VAAGSSLGLWDPWSGHPRQALRGHAQRIGCLAFSTDSAWLVSGDAAGELRSWRTTTGESGHGLSHQGDIVSLALSGDGAWLAWGARDGVVLVSAWSPHSIDRIRQIEGQGRPVVALRFSADHQWLVIGKGAMPERGAPQSRQDARHGARPEADAAASQLRLWNVARGELTQAHPLADLTLTDLATSRDGRWLALGGRSGEVRLVAPDDGRALRRWPREQQGITAAALSPDQHWLATGREDGHVSLWNPDGGRLLRDMPVHRAPVSALGFSSDGRWWASGAADGSLLLWGRGRPHPLRARPGLCHLSFCPGGHWLALAGQDGHVQLLPLQDPLPSTLPTLHKAPGGILALRFSAHSHLLAWLDGLGNVTCCDPVSGLVRSTHRLAVANLVSAALSNDLRWLAGATREGLLRLWDLNSNREVWRAHLPAGGETALLFSPDDRVLQACDGSGSRTDWDVAAGPCLQRRDASFPGLVCRALAGVGAGFPEATLETGGFRLVPD
jgi:WD40 repeat protein